MFKELARTALGIAGALTLATATLATATLATAEAYKTTDGTVVVTGLPPTQRYQIRMLDAQSKPGSRQDKGANSCGEVVIEKAAQYKTLVVGTTTIDPAALPVQTYVRCKPQTAVRQPTQKGVVLATTPGVR